MRELSSCCRLGGSSARLQLLKHLEGRPYGALSFRPYGLPRVWSPLQGYAPWALEGSPLWGLTRPVVASRAKNTISSTRGHEPRIRPPRYCASIHGYCGISSQGAAVCAPKAPQFCSRVLRYFLPRCCSMCSQGTAVLLTSTAVFPPKAQQYAHLRVCGMCPQGTAVPLTG